MRNSLYFIFCLLFMTPLSALSAVDIREFDANKDGKIDMQQSYNAAGEIIEEKIDRNFDGFWDEKVIYLEPLTKIQKFFIPNSLDPYLIIETKSQNDRKYITHTLPGISINGHKASISQIKPKGENKELTANEINCFTQPQVAKELADLYSLANILDAKTPKFFPAPNHKDYLQSNLGVLVQKSCVKRYGEKRLYSLLRSSIQEGVSCMLAHAASPIANQNVEKISAVLNNKKKPLMLNCEINGCWDGKVAEASVKNKQGNPYINLSPLVDEYKKDDIFFKSTFFHELLHTCGHDHHNTVDYAHACDGCCYDTKFLNEKSKQAACEICGGKFAEAHSPAYLSKLFDWSEGHQYEYARTAFLDLVETQLLHEPGLNPDKTNQILKAYAQLPDQRLIAATILEMADEFPLSNQDRKKWQAKLKDTRPAGPRTGLPALLRAYKAYYEYDVEGMFPHLMEAAANTTPANFKEKVAELFLNDREVKISAKIENSEDLKNQMELVRNKLQIKNTLNSKAECDYPWPPKSAVKRAK